MNPNKTLICLYLICFSLLILASCEKDEENDYGEKLLSFFTQNRILLSIFEPAQTPFKDIQNKFKIEKLNKDLEESQEKIQENESNDKEKEYKEELEDTELLEEKEDKMESMHLEEKDIQYEANKINTEEKDNLLDEEESIINQDSIENPKSLRKEFIPSLNISPAMEFKYNTTSPFPNVCYAYNAFECAYITPIGQHENKSTKTIDNEIPSMHKWIEKILSQMNSQTRGHKGNKIDLEDLENRINFASSECGAKVTATNAEARESSSILVGSKDRYLLTPCDVDRWVVIQLCEEVGIEIIQLANYEFFSSMFKDFMVYGTNKYQEEKTEWTLIGNFTAQNKRTIQHFTFEEIAWWKYLRIEFFSYYGTQFFCPISEIKVFGMSIVEELKEEFKKENEDIAELNKLISNRNQEEGLSQLSDNPYSHLFEDHSSSLNDPVDSESWASLLMAAKELIENGNKNLNKYPLVNPTSDLSGVVHSYTSPLDHSSHTKNPENVLKTLATKVKHLEFNQSLTNRYLEDISSKYLQVFREIKTSINKLEAKNLDLSKILHTTLSLGTKTEQKINLYDPKKLLNKIKKLNKTNVELTQRIQKLEENLQNLQFPNVKYLVYSISILVAFSLICNVLLWIIFLKCSSNASSTSSPSAPPSATQKELPYNSFKSLASTTLLSKAPYQTTKGTGQSTPTQTHSLTDIRTGATKKRNNRSPRKPYKEPEFANTP